MDRDSGLAPDGGRRAEARPSGGASAQARDRPGRSGLGGGGRSGARARRAQGSEPADRLVHFSRTDRRGQNRAGAGARAIPVRRRSRDDPHRHVRVHGKAHRLAAGRRAARLRRLRRGRATDGSRAPPSVLRDPVRRNREGASGRLQRAAPDSRRRPAHRRPGPHGGLQERGRDHDLEYRGPVDPVVQGTGLRKNESRNAST